MLKRLALVHEVEALQVCRQPGEEVSSDLSLLKGATKAMHEEGQQGKQGGWVCQGAELELEFQWSL